MRKWTLKAALNVSSGEIIKMKVPERAELAAFLQAQLKRRVSTYKRSKAYSHPYAYQKLMDDFKELSEAADYNFDFMSPIIVSKGRVHELGPAYAALDFPNQKLHSYIAQLQEFFSSKSSTVSGWKDIIRNESEKLFGATEYTRNYKGRTISVKRLNHLMTEEEREHFWKLYEEIRKSGRTIMYDSESMRETGFTRIWRDKLKKDEWNFDDLTGMMNDMLQAMKANGAFVRDMPEHVPGKSWDPTRPDLAGEDVFEEFDWDA